MKKIRKFIFIICVLTGEFIIYYLLKNGFKHVTDKKDIEENTFLTIISDMGQFYSIEVYFKKYKNRTCKKITFYDSLKIIPFSVKDIAKSFGLPISKLEIDYKKEREKGHILTSEEKDYIKNDVLIVAKALNVIFNEGLTKMTQASNALSDFRKIIKENKFEHYYIHLDKVLDEEIRKSYKGGFTYLSPEYKEKDVRKTVLFLMLIRYILLLCTMKNILLVSLSFLRVNIKKIKYMTYIYKYLIVLLN